MQVHLALPGLLWPARALPDVMYGLDVPALAWLLGRARIAREEPLPLERWLAGRFGIETEEPPLAALRLLGEDGAPGTAHWLCADPAHLAFEHGRPLLDDPARLALEPGEIEELAAALAPVFAGVGGFALLPSGHGYLELAQPAALTTVPLSAAVGRGAASLLPRGTDAAHWVRLANEAQIALHDLPLNQRREVAGRPVVNTLWFWGAGALPPVGMTPYTKVGSGETAAPLARGLARHAGIAWQAADATLDGHSLLLEERLLAPAQQLDAEAWRKALLAVERERLAPLAAALRSGKLKRLTVTALGDDTRLELELRRSDALRFWRRPRPLTKALA